MEKQMQNVACFLKDKNKYRERICRKNADMQL